MATLDGAPKSARVQISDDDASLPVLVSPHRASRHKRDSHCVSDHERDCRLDFPTRMAPGGVPPRRCVLDRPIGSAGAPRGARPPPFHAFLGGPCSHRPGETGVVPPDCVLPRSSPPASLAPLLGRPVDALPIPHSTHFLAPYDTLRPEPGCVPPGCALPPPPLSTGSTRGSCAHPPRLGTPPASLSNPSLARGCVLPRRRPSAPTAMSGGSVASPCPPNTGSLRPVVSPPLPDTPLWAGCAPGSVLGGCTHFSYAWRGVLLAVSPHAAPNGAGAALLLRSATTTSTVVFLPTATHRHRVVTLYALADHRFCVH